MGSQITKPQISTVSPLGWNFWFQWLIANAAGFAIGMVIRQFMFGIGPWAINPIVIGAVMGTAVGVAQMFNLQPYIGRPGWWWVLSNTIGWSIGWAAGLRLGWALFGSLGFKAVDIVILAAAGLLSGAIQWFMLRQQYRQAGWWIVANTIGWGTGMAAGVVIVGGAFGWPAVGAVSGAMAGFPLAWILRHPRR